MSTKRIVALVVGCVLILPALGMLLAGGALAVGYATGLRFAMPSVDKLD